MNNETQQEGGASLKDELVAAFKAAIPAAPQPAQPQMTDDQIRQMLGYWRPDQQFIGGLFGDNAGDQHAQLLGTMFDQIEQMIDKRASVIAQGMLGDFYGNVKPHLDDAREVAESRFRERLFSGDGEAFKPYEKLLDKLMPQMQQEADFPRSRSEQIPYLHKKFGELVSQADPQFKGTTQGQRQQAAPVTPLPAFGGGAGGQGGAAKSVNPATATAPMSLAQVMGAAT